MLDLLLPLPVLDDSLCSAKSWGTLCCPRQSMRISSPKVETGPVLPRSNAVRGFGARCCAIARPWGICHVGWPQANARQFSWQKRKGPHYWLTNEEPGTLPSNAALTWLGAYGSSGKPNNRG